MELVWVDAPDPSMCGNSDVGRCCLNGRFGRQYEWRNFANGEMKQKANEQLWAESQYLNLDYYEGMIKSISKQ